MKIETVPTQQGLDALRASMPDRVFLPEDPDWDQVRLPWALFVDQHPAAVVVARDVDDVVQTVRIAAESSLSIAAQPVGHGATTAISGSVVLRTRALDEIEIDPVARRVRVGAGVKWGELLQALSGHGLVGLVGSNPDPSVVGYTLGGGLSWFSRKYGLAANSVTAIELVNATGQLVRVTADSDPDLFWALRGGGGDFGIVTAMEFSLFDEPDIYGGLLMWPISEADAVLRAFREVTASAPDELTLWFQLLHFPPIEELPEALRGQNFASVTVTYLGTEEAAEALLKPLRVLPDPAMGGLGAVPVEMLGGLNQEPTSPTPSLDFCSGLADLSDDVIDRLLEVQGHGVQSPLVVVQIRHLGGAFARSHKGDGVASAPQEPYLLFSFGVPAIPELVGAINGSHAELADVLGDHLTGWSPYSFVNDPHPGRVFSAETLARLQSIKTERDPAGVFRSNRPVHGVA